MTTSCVEEKKQTCRKEVMLSAVCELKYIRKRGVETPGAGVTDRVQRGIQKYQSKKERFIQLGLFEAERRWASAMSDKMEMEDNLDKMLERMSMRMHLRRSFLHAAALVQLVRNSSRCDAPTKLETQAYTAWLAGVCAFEMRRWPEACELLKNARKVYERLAEPTHNTTLANLQSKVSRDSTADSTLRIQLR